MGREGPCCHCGIDYTPLWRCGPPEKPVLCNACGSRWRIRGTLNDYTPKHAIKDAQSCDVPSKETVSIPFAVGDCRKPKAGAGVAAHDHSTTCFGDGTNNKSSSGSTSTENCIHTGNINGPNKPNFMNRRFVPRRRRSVLSQRMLSPMERLNKQLFDLMLEHPNFLKKHEDSDVLIYDTQNLLSTPLETPLGAILLKPPPTQSTKEVDQPNASSVTKNKASCSTDHNPLEPSIVLSVI